MLENGTLSPFVDSRKGVSKGKLTRAKALGKEGASRFFFLPSLDAPRTHLILPINHSANTEKLLGTGMVLLIFIYYSFDVLVPVRPVPIALGNFWATLVVGITILQFKQPRTTLPF